MNTDMAQLIVVLKAVLESANKGKLSKEDYQMCTEILGALSSKYRAGVAALEATRDILEA